MLREQFDLEQKQYGPFIYVAFKMIFDMSLKKDLTKRWLYSDAKGVFFCWFLEGASRLVDLDAQLGLQVLVHHEQIVNTINSPDRQISLSGQIRLKIIIV